MTSTIQPAPSATLVIKEIKVCQGCMQEFGSKYELSGFKKWTKQELLAEGILDRWNAQVKHGNRIEPRVVVRHEKNHSECYNYIIEVVKKILYQHLEVD